MPSAATSIFSDTLDERDLRLISEIKNGKRQWMIQFLSVGFNAIHIGRVYISGVGSHCQFSDGHATVPRAPVVAQHLMYPECSFGVPVGFEYLPCFDQTVHGEIMFPVTWRFEKHWNVMGRYYA